MRRRAAALLLLASSVAAAGNRLTDLTWRRANDALSDHRLAVAAELFRDYREAHPDEAFAWVMEAWTRRSLGEVQAADRLYSGALAIDPQQPDALYHKAYAAFDRREPEAALEWLSRFGDVPEHLYNDYHELFGVTLILADRDPEGAVDHLRKSRLDQPTSRLLLALAYTRLGLWEAAEPYLDEVCPRPANAGLIDTWIACLDVDYCGELAAQRLEILQRVYQREDDVDHLADVVRVHLRHSTCAGGLRPAIERELRIVDPGDRCALRLLGALYESCGEVGVDGCESLRRAGACAAAAAVAGWRGETLSGPVFDPATGALLDLNDLSGETTRLLRSRCEGDSAPR
jgi:tetratricopeptide (TPR) repeat protein